MIIKKLIKIILLLIIEVIFLRCVRDLIGFYKTITEGTVYDKIIYLLYNNNDHWWNSLPMDVDYRYISREIDLIEIKTDEMSIRTVSDPPGISRTENKIIIIKWDTTDMNNLVYYIEMNKTGIVDKSMTFHYKGDYYEITYTDAYDQEEVHLLESVTGKKESEIREYKEKCDMNTEEFIENLCHREKYSLLIQILIYIGMIAVGFKGIIHIARKRESV